jgi:hypothetical protein
MNSMRDFCNYADWIELLQETANRGDSALKFVKFLVRKSTGYLEHEIFH